MKKKIIFLISVVLILIVSCKKNTFTITGTVLDSVYEGKNIYLQQKTDSLDLLLDSAIIQNGSFQLKGKASTPFLGIVVLNRGISSVIQSQVEVLLEPGALEITFDTITQVKGTPVNEAYTTLRNNLRKSMLEFRLIRDQYYSEEDEVKIDSLKNVLSDFETKSYVLNYEFVKNNISNELGRFIFAQNHAMFSAEQQKELLDMTDESFKNSKNVKELADKLYGRVEENSLNGKHFADFTLNDAYGTRVSLSDYAGKKKSVLLFFWSSHCERCEEDIIALKELYTLYRDSGLEIVGVSLDEQQNEWFESTKKYDIKWINLTDAKALQSPILSLYSVSDLPSNFLIDENGVIILENESIEKISSQVSELFSE